MKIPINQVSSKPWSWITFQKRFTSTLSHTFAVLSSEKTLMSSMWSLSVLSLLLLVSACHLVSGSEVTEMDWLTGSVTFLSDVTEPPVSLD